MPGEPEEQTVAMDQGRYLLLCFIPQNTPPDVVADMMESSSRRHPRQMPDHRMWRWAWSI